MSEDKKRIIVGITGASGAIYALHTVRALLANGIEVHLIVSDYGAYVIESETEFSLKSGNLLESFRSKYGDEVLNGSVVKYSNKDSGGDNFQRIIQNERDGRRSMFHENACGSCARCCREFN